MIPRELSAVLLAATAVGMFLFARSIDTLAVTTATATSPSGSTNRLATVTSASVPVGKAEATPEPTVEPAPVAVQPAPVPVQPSPPPPTRLGTAAQPPRRTSNPDDAPERTVSGKVKASTDPKLAPAFGPKKSKVHVTVISDFQCPVCRRAVEATHQIAEEWPGDVRVTFYQHPLKMHKNAEAAAAASLAAHAQGKFWDFHDVLFQNQRALDRLSLFAYAERMGLDMNRFKKDFESTSLRTRIQGESAMAEALGARGTPAFLINGKISVGWGSWNGFRGQVLRELKQVNAMLDQGKKQGDVIVARARENAKDKAAFKVYSEGVLKPLGVVSK